MDSSASQPDSTAVMEDSDLRDMVREITTDEHRKAEKEAEERGSRSRSSAAEMLRYLHD